MSLIEFKNNYRDFAVNAGDEIFATAIHVGRIIYNAVFTGIASVDELLKKLSRELSQYSGIVTVKLRNRTQGTSSRRVLRVVGNQKFMLSQAV